MEKTLKVINELKNKKAISDYAIGGGIAVLYYVEPLLTYDLDIFFIPIEASLNVLAPIYKYMRGRGYKIQREHILIEGVPTQFIPVYNELIKEAVQNSTEVEYGKTKTKVLSLEYLVAVMLQTYRAKDRERIIKIFEEVKVNLNFLRKLLKKHNLDEKYAKFRGLYFEGK
ncbi:MAG: hypothetical protein ACETWK_08195 [Candidatus Aminicenantaceae bacterium]